MSGIARDEESPHWLREHPPLDYTPFLGKEHVFVHHRHHRRSLSPVRRRSIQLGAPPGGQTPAPPAPTTPSLRPRTRQKAAPSGSATVTRRSRRLAVTAAAANATATPAPVPARDAGDANDSAARSRPVRPRGRQPIASSDDSLADDGSGDGSSYFDDNFGSGSSLPPPSSSFEDDADPDITLSRLTPEPGDRGLLSRGPLSFFASFGAAALSVLSPSRRHVETPADDNAAAGSAGAEPLEDADATPRPASVPPYSDADADTDGSAPAAPPTQPASSPFAVALGNVWGAIAARSPLRQPPLTASDLEDDGAAGAAASADADASAAPDDDDTSSAAMSLDTTPVRTTPVHASPALRRSTRHAAAAATAAIAAAAAAAAERAVCDDENAAVLSGDAKPAVVVDLDGASVERQSLVAWLWSAVFGTLRMRLAKRAGLASCAAVAANMRVAASSFASARVAHRLGYHGRRAASRARHARRC